ncbi:MAG: CsbD family protein [Deltaproteobacteria bacterium]|nr:CsbD family protein [Deltaproteobacteria bacterium]
MNQYQANDNWDQTKQRLKIAWGKLSTDDCKKAWETLTDDDFKRAEGSIDQLYHVILEKFGDTAEAIRSKLDKSFNRANTL